MLSNELYLQHFDHAHKTPDLTSNHIMRGINPHNGGLADGKPSKLDLMRADYQKKLLKEKEEKLVQIYEDNQKKVMKRMTRNGSGSKHRSGSNVSGERSVLKYSNERQRMQTNGVTSTDHHYGQTRHTSAPKEWTGRGDNGTVLSVYKSSAGRDRSQPLAPLRRPQDIQDVAQASKSGIPQKLPVVPAGHGDDNPFPQRARLMKHRPLPLSNKHLAVNNSNHNGAGDPKAMQASHNNHKLIHGRSLHAPNQLSTALDKPVTDPKNERAQSIIQEKLTDYQKWQVDQSHARDERLKKLNVAMALNDTNDVWKLSEEYAVEVESDNVSNDVNEDSHDRNIGIYKENSMIAKEKELMEKISDRQRELERIRKERELQEEQEKREQDRQKKKETTERRRQIKLTEEKRREEAKRLKQEENEIRLEMQRDDKKRKEEEKRSKEDEKYMKEDGKRRPQKENFRPNREDERMSSKLIDKMSPVNSSSRNNHAAIDDISSPLSVKPTASGPKISREPQPSKSKMDSSDPDERRLSLSDAHVYEQAAASYAARVSVGDLSKCQLCGRSFLKDRLLKHQDACAKANKPRKEFDSAKKRVEGTELAKYAGKAKRPDPPKKKSNWRAKHEEFIQNLRHAKKVTKCEKEGGDLRKITPPPTSVNPDYVPCPHCGRTFNESAAERHIPRCQSLKTRPPPMNTRRR